MSKTVKKCINCAWRENRRVRIPNIHADVPSSEPKFRCARTNTHVLLSDSCDYWFGFYGSPVQLDFLGNT